MKKLGCAKCGGMKKMAKGGTNNVNISKPGAGYAKPTIGSTNQSMGIFGIPQSQQGEMDGKTGKMKKGGSIKEHPITTFRKANEARQAVVKKSLPKAQDGMTTNYPGKPIAKAPSNNYRIDPNHRKVDTRSDKSVTVPTKGGIKPTKTDKSRVRAGVTKSDSPIKNANPTKEPRVKFGNPMVGIPTRQPKPKGRYEDAVINTKSPSTSYNSPKSSGTALVKKTVGPRPSVDEMREAKPKAQLGSIVKTVAKFAKPAVKSASGYTKPVAQNIIKDTKVVVRPVNRAAKPVAKKLDRKSADRFIINQSQAKAVKENDKADWKAMKTAIALTSAVPVGAAVKGLVNKPKDTSKAKVKPKKK